MMLEELLKEQKLTNGVHDSIIKQVASTNEISPNVMTLFMSAYYKIGRFEGDIDLLQLLYDSKNYKEIFDYKEIPFGDSKLLLFEMKSTDSTKNYRKALSQLHKSKEVIKKYTDYDNIDCFYAFKCNTRYIMRYEQVD